VGWAVASANRRARADVDWVASADVLGLASAEEGLRALVLGLGWSVLVDRVDLARSLKRDGDNVHVLPARMRREGSGWCVAGWASFKERTSEEKELSLVLSKKN
jgi:hypothetical protein